MITKRKDRFESKKLDELTDELETALPCIAWRWQNSCVGKPRRS
jgi:hypothetical protein